MAEIGNTDIVPHATDKPNSKRDAGQTLRQAFNEADHTLGVNGFIVGAVGRKVTLTIATTTNPNDTEVYSFFQNQTELLYTIEVRYVDGSRETLLEVERTA